MKSESLWYHANFKAYAGLQSSQPEAQQHTAGSWLFIYFALLKEIKAWARICVFLLQEKKYPDTKYTGHQAAFTTHH